MDKKDDRGREIIDLGEVREEDISIFEVGQDSPPFGEEAPPFGEDSPPFTEDSLPFAGESGGEGPPVFKKAENSKELEETIQKVLDLETTLSQLDSSITIVKKLNEETSEKVTGMEKNIQALMKVYEKITNKMDPFMEDRIQPEVAAKDGGREFLIQTEESQDHIGEIGIMQENQSQDTTEITEEEGSNNNAMVSPTQAEEDQEFMGEVGEVQERESQNTVKTIEEGGAIGALLEELDNAPSSTMILLKWLDFLLQRGGTKGLTETLEFYKNIGWISPNVKEKMMKFTGGLNKDNVTGSKSEGLKIEDHAISLFFISKIKGHTINLGVFPFSSNLRELGIIDE